MTIHWRCSTCGETGHYDAATAPKTDAALPDAKHAKATGHVVTTGTDAGRLARMAGGAA